MNHSDVAVIRGPIDATLTNSEGFRCCYKEMGVGFGPFRAKAKVNIQTAFTCLTLLKQAGLPFTLDVFEVAQILMSIGFNFKATTKSSIVHVVLDNGASVRHSIGCRFAQQGQWGGGAADSTVVVPATNTLPNTLPGCALLSKQQTQYRASCSL